MSWKLKGTTMSTMQAKMAALTGGNTASASSLRQLLDIADRPGGGANRQIDPSPAMRTRPDLN